MKQYQILQMFNSEAAMKEKVAKIGVCQVT